MLLLLNDRFTSIVSRSSCPQQPYTASGLQEVSTSVNGEREHCPFASSPLKCSNALSSSLALSSGRRRFVRKFMSCKSAAEGQAPLSCL